MKLRIRYGVGRWVMGRWRGKVLYPFVLFSQSREEVSDELFRHELEHVYQVWRMGCVWFYLKYLALAIRYGYKNHPFELEANERQSDPLTEKELVLRNGPKELSDTFE